MANKKLIRKLKSKPKKSIRDNLSEGFTDFGTRTLNAVRTVGMSAVGDAVNAVSPKAADWLEKYTYDIIPHTSQERLEANRSDNSNRWKNRRIDATSAVTSGAAEIALNTALPVIGKGLKKEISKGINKVVHKINNITKNTHKLNPLAFKINKDAYYRGIGKEGYENILESGVVRSKKQIAYPEPYFVKGRDAGNYTKGYMIELADEPMKGVGSFRDGDLIQTPINKINSNNLNLKLYKEHWLKGYKELPKNTPQKIGKNIKHVMDKPSSKVDILTNKINSLDNTVGNLSKGDKVGVINFDYKPNLTSAEKIKTIFMSKRNKQVFLGNKAVDDGFAFADRALKSPEYADRFAKVKGLTSSPKQDITNIATHIRNGIKDGSIPIPEYYNADEIYKMTDDKILDNFLNAYRNNSSDVLPNSINMIPYANRTNTTPSRTSVQHLRKHIDIDPFNNEKRGTYSPNKLVDIDNIRPESIKVKSKNLGDLYNVTVHEALGHGKTYGNVSLTQREKEMAKSVFKTNNSASSYLRTPTEIIARVDEIRSVISKDNPYKIVSEKDIDNFMNMVNKDKYISKNTKGEGSTMFQFMSNIDKSKLTRFMNTFYGTIPAAVGIKELNNKSQSNDWLNKYK